MYDKCHNCGGTPARERQLIWGGFLERVACPCGRATKWVHGDRGGFHRCELAWLWQTVNEKKESES